MSPVSGIVRMNIAAMDSGDLVLMKGAMYIGLGVELVNVDTYVSELVPRSHRGRAYAYNQFLQFLAVPLVAFLAWLLVPNMPLGLDGWRWVVLIGSAGAIFIWFIRLSLPESPRWLALHGRMTEAERVVAGIESRVTMESGKTAADGPAAARRSGRGDVRGDLAAAL